MVLSTGTVRNPHTGKSVPWALAKCLQREAAVAESLGITVWGIGNPDHLDNIPAGGHTPYRSGSPVGVVWAIDVMLDHKGQAYLSAFEKWLIGYLKSDADTTWIRFLNVNGSQYLYNGVRRRDSGDHHLHLEVENGAQNAVTGLMQAWKDHVTPGKPVPPKPKGDPLVKLIQKGNAIYKTDGWRTEHVPGPSDRQGYKDLVAVWGEPVKVLGDLKDFQTEGDQE